MKERSFLESLVPGKNPTPKRIREDNDRMRESSIGAEDMADFARGKKVKPRAVRDWEKNQ